MGIDWSNEDYARLYKRETDDDLLLSWEARAVWHEFLKRCDKSGFLETKRGVKGFAALIRIPTDVVERVLQELIEDGRLQSVPHAGFLAPNYVTANYVARSDRARQAQSRLSRRVAGRAGSSGEQSEGSDSGSDSASDENHESVSRDVTSSHERSHFSHPIHPKAFRPPSSARAREGRPRFHKIPEDWQPREQERTEALSYGLDPDAEAKEFRTHWLGDGRTKENWDLAFSSRLQAQARVRNRGKREEEVRNVDDM